MNTTTQPTVLVLGASGQVGSEVCRLLSEAGAGVRAATRDARTITPHHGVAPVTVDVTAPASLEAAAEGVDATFLMWPFLQGAADARPAARSVARILGARVPRVVYLSSLTAANDHDTVWGAVEDAVEEHVAQWTMLRPTGFAANARQWIGQIAMGDVVRWPLGRLARPFIHETDMAAVAVQALLSDAHHGTRPVLTGPELATQEQQLTAIAAVIGRPLTWHELDHEQAQSELGLPAGMLAAWETFLTEPEPVNDEVARLTGRRARTVQEWAEDNVDLFR